MIALLIIYTLHCILNYYANYQMGANMHIKLQLIVAGFWCTPAGILLLIDVLIKGQQAYEDVYFNNIFGTPETVIKNSYIFSTVINVILILIFVS